MNTFADRRIADAEPPDPAFALLEAHKAAWARFFDDHEACEWAAGATPPPGMRDRHGVSRRVRRT
jgi:hypothetical protein